MKAAIEALKADAGDISNHGALIISDLPKIVVRLYTQSEDERIKHQALDAIDEMEQAEFFGLAAELRKVER